MCSGAARALSPGALTTEWGLRVPVRGQGTRCHVLWVPEVAVVTWMRREGCVLRGAVPVCRVVGPWVPWVPGERAGGAL